MTRIFKDGIAAVFPGLVRYYRSSRNGSILFGVLWSILRRKYRTEGMSFSVPRYAYPMSCRASFYFDTYELGERELTKRLLSKGDQVLELGGGMGVMACLIDSLIDGGKHVVLEANPSVLGYLEKNRLKNGASFFPMLGAYSDEPFVQFDATDHFAAGRLSSLGKIRVPGFTACEILQKFGSFNVLIADIEGAEIELIAEVAIPTTPFSKIVLEFHPHITGKEVIDVAVEKLRSVGFKQVEQLGNVVSFQK